MADQHNANIPAMGNQISADIPDIKENLEFHKDAFQAIFETWSDSDNSSSKLDSAIGFSDGTYNYEIPTNGVGASSVFMLGTSDTIVWMYLNVAPPGWKVTTTGKGTVLSVSDTTGSSAGTTDGTTANKLVDSGADFVTDGIEVGDTAYNTTDATVATVTAVDDLNTLSIDGDVFVSGEGYVVGKAFVEAGGRQASDGTWTVGGLTKDAHTHTGPSHNHQWYNYIDNAGAEDQSYNSGGTAIDFNKTGTAKAVGSEIIEISDGSGSPQGMGADCYTTNAGTGNTGAQSDSAVTQDATWRPTSSIGKLYQLDTA